MKKVLVIVVAYNGMQWLERCLGSVPAWADLYVFDNNSTDGSPDCVAAHFPGAKLVRSAENLGFSRANNQGFAWAVRKGYDYAYLLNQDAWLEEGALETLVDAAESHPAYGVLSPLQMADADGTMDARFERIFRAAQQEICEVKRVMAAHWLVPLRVLERIGPFEEKLFPLYGQDDEWCLRLHYFGFKVGVVPRARAVHDRARRVESLETRVMRDYYSASLLRLVDVCRPLWRQWTLVCLYTLVKTLRYCSLLPVSGFFRLLQQGTAVREHRALVRVRAHDAK